MNYFKTKVKYDKICDDGVQRTVTEEYLVEALSWGEAEMKITKEMQGQALGDFTITDIRLFKVDEAFLATQDYYFKVRLYFLHLDEKSGREKKTAVNMLVSANDINEAKEIIVSEMKKTPIDYTIQKIEETKIISVIGLGKEKE